MPTPDSGNKAVAHSESAYAIASAVPGCQHGLDAFGDIRCDLGCRVSFATDPFRMASRPVPISTMKAFGVRSGSAAITLGLPALGVTIRGIFGMGSGPDVRGVAARAVFNAPDRIAHVARVQSAGLAIREFSVAQLPSASMGHLSPSCLSAVEVEQAIAKAVLMPKPRPAFIGSTNINLGPKAFFGSKLASSHEHLQCCVVRGRAGSGVPSGSAYSNTIEGAPPCA